MAADRVRADEEDLKVSSFQKGEWGQTRPTELDVDYYALLAEALGPAGAPVAELHDATVVAAASGASGLCMSQGSWRGAC